MKRALMVSFLVVLVVLMGCSNEEQQFEHFFQQKMMEMHVGEKNYTYTLVHKELNVVHDGDAIAIFLEQKDHEETIYIAYFEKEKNQWEWKQTRGAKWHSPVQWSAMNSEPYIYSGTISDNSIVEIFVGDELAKLLPIENDKRFWYAISPIQDVKVKAIHEKGVKEMIEEINEEF
ncbi:hypothetical protein [Lysinibacillus sp. HST-98]|uniref:hypothetical protein n=1 Tax=Lysinibacillus sp. HST-98 TaxID=2800419 RepID=UPI001F35970C|nr:hypothetical protein [Lysinibacillus sp. HST-98]